MRDRPFGCPLSERDIQRAVFDHIKARGVPGVVAWHTPNGGIHQAGRRRAINAGQGVVSGIPDVIAIKQGTMFALELKRDKGRVSEAQRDTLDRLAFAGAVVAVAHGLDAAIEQLERWGIVRGEKR